MWVLGNGESRQKLNVNNLQGTKVGCNAIIRDYQVDHLVCVDRRMVEEAIGYNTKIYTRKDWLDTYKTLGVMHVPDLIHQGTQRWDEPFHWGSGPYAVLLSAKITEERSKKDYDYNVVNLVGFDLHSKTKTVNNIYKDTKSYDAKDKNAVDPRYWIHQISKVFEWFPKLNFVIYQNKDWELPETWKKQNVSLDNLDNLLYNK